MTTMFIPTPSAPTPPQSYESYLETPEGVYVKVVYHTDNKAAADRYADHVNQVIGWKVLDAPAQVPATLWSKIGSAWAAAIGIPVVLGFAAFILAFVAHMANYISFDDIETVIQWAARLGLWSFPIIGLVGSAVAIITHSSGKSNV